MATFEELFPNSGEAAPFEPVSLGENNQRLTDIRSRVRQAIPTGGNADGLNSGSGTFLAAFGDILNTLPKEAEPEAQTNWSDYGKAIMGGVGSMGEMIGGAGEYIGTQGAGDQSTGPGQQMAVMGQAFRELRQESRQFAQDWFAKMSPEAQQRVERELLTLDPNKTIWQGGSREFLSSIALKLSQSTPSTLATLLPGALMMRAGMTGGGLAYLGASEGGLSMGSIAANIATEIEQAPEEELMQSARYQELRGSLDEPQARQQLIKEAQGYAPVVGGLVVGAISAASGRYLEPVLTGGKGALGRFAGGFKSEAPQEASQSAAEQLAQNWAAQVYDSDRALSQGVAESAAQGTVVGGLSGGVMTTALGRGPQTPQAIPTDEATTQSTPGKSFESVFGEYSQEQPATPSWRGSDIETGALPDVDSTGQRLLAVGDVDPDIQAALNARREGRIDDMFENQGMSPQQEQRSYIEKPFPVSQQEMDLPPQQMGMVPSGDPVQQPLLEERVRGAGRVPLEPMQAQPLQDDPGAPLEFSQERLPQSDLMPTGRPTRADFMRARAEQDRAGRYAGMLRDDTQLDMFNQPQMPDEPSAEPLGDLLAQLEELKDPDNDRVGVYLSPMNIQQLQKDNTFERVRGVGVPLANFDGKGGTLIAKNNRAAKELLAMRDQGAANMQEILGMATGAGAGKPAGADIAVQQRDEQGNVVRESLVASPEEADALAESFDQTPDREGVILSAGMAIKRRAQRIREESRQAQAVGDSKQIRRRAETLIEEEFGDTPLATKAAKKIGRKPLSDNEAARKLVGYSARLRKRELKKHIGEVSLPEVLEFADAKATRGYEELFGQYRDAEIAERLATTAEDTARAKTHRTSIGRQIDAYRRLNKTTTKSERVARVARKISPEEVQKIERAARETARTKATGETTLDAATAETVSSLTPEKLSEMSEAETNVLFTQAAEYFAGRRKAGRTYSEILADHPTQSERKKLISRMQVTIRRRAHGGKTKTSPMTSTAVKRESATGEKAATRKGTFKPQRAFNTEPPREMSREQASKHNARVRETFHKLGTAIESLRASIDKVMKPMFMTMARQREANGNPPHTARNAVYGRVYLRALYRYGKLLEQLRPRSVGGLKEVEQYTKTIQNLIDTPKDKFVAKLAQLTEAEIGEQVKAAVRVDPENLKHLNNRRKRSATALKFNRELRRQVAWSKRLHDVWHANSKYNELVAPVMQKLIGYVTHDIEFANVEVERRGLGYIPSFSEMRNVRYALRSFKTENNTELYKPLRRWFADYGFKFDTEGDLILAKNASQHDAVMKNERLHAERDKNSMRGVPLNYNQKKAAYQAIKAEVKQDKPLNLDLIGLQKDPDATRATAIAVSSAIEENNVAPLTKLLQLAAARLPASHAYQSLLKRLIDLNMEDVIVGWDTTGKVIGHDALATMRTTTESSGEQYRSIMLNRPQFERIRERGDDPMDGFLHTLLHEAVHAATHGALSNNPRAKAAIWAIMRQARSAAAARGIEGLERTYGFRDNSVDEFIAEAFSNQEFQNKLRSIQVAPRTTLWQALISLVKRLLGLESVPNVENVLDIVLATTDKLFTGEMARPTKGMQETLNMVDDKAAKSHIGNVLDKVMQSSRVTQDVRKRATDILEKNKEGGSRFLLSALTMEQMRDFYGREFGGAGGPLNEYMKTFFQRNADNSTNMETADKLSREWTKLTEEKTEGALETSRLMVEGTLYGMHIDKPVTSQDNAHIKSSEQKARHADLSARYKALSPEWKQLYKDVENFYDQSLRREVNLMTLNALRSALATGDDPALRRFTYTEQDIESKKLNTHAGLEKEFGDKLEPDQRKIIMTIAALPQQRIGPYFPLMRFGDYIVSADHVREKKNFSDEADARTWEREQRESDPTLSIHTQEEAGGYTVVVTEKEVRMAESPSEAEKNRQEMIAEYGDANVSDVMLKSQLYGKGATISSGSALGTIMGKLKGNPAAQAAIKDFYLRTLADGAFRKHEIKRANRRGVNYDFQHRTFASYAKSAAYYTSQLRFGWKLADQLIAMDKYVTATAKGEHESNISAIRMGEVVREIDTRDKLTTDHIEVSKLVRKGTALSQFMMLTSPSYWMINATQPYMVTLPWLAARSSIGDATAALLHAQKMIASPIVNQMGESLGGAKALWSKTSAEKAFTVLEQVEEYIKQRGGGRATEYINMLNKLKRESIIDLSFVAELRDIAEGQDAGLTQRVLDASRIMSHLTEVNNRIMTAIAAYDLYRNKGMSPTEATSFAQQAVSLTQFNYSSGNAPRLFQARGPLGQMGPLVFQFMKYPQHIYALLIDNMRRAVASKSIDRDVARKTLAGIFATHLAAGGVVGAMLQPIKWAIGLAMAAFGDDDEPYTVANALSGETFDRMIRNASSELFGTDMGEIVSAGLPRAAGIDVSSRMSLGSLYFIDLKTDTAESTIGSVASAFGGPLVNLGAGWMRGAQYMNEGQVQKGMEAFLPKGAKDILRMIRYSSEGLTDASGKEIIGAKDMSAGQLFAQSMGFQPAAVAEAYARRSAIKDAQSTGQDRRSSLLSRFSNARTPGERQAVLDDIASFNKDNPVAGITRSQLLKSAENFRQSAQRTSMYGVDLKRRDLAYLEEGDAYNVDEEE